MRLAATALAVLFTLQMVFPSHMTDLSSVNVAVQNVVRSGNSSLAILDFANGFGPDPRIYTLLAIGLLANIDSRARVLRYLTVVFAGQLARWSLALVFKSPRPCWINAHVQELHCVQTFSYPSGHSTMYGALLMSIGDEHPWLSVQFVGWIWFAVMCLGRLYVGTHYVHDIAAGFFLGSLIHDVFDVPAVVRLSQSIADLYRYVKLPLVSLVVAFCFLAVYVFARLERTDVNPGYGALAARYHCPPPNPYDPRDGYEAVVSFAGVALALVFSPPVSLRSDEEELHAPGVVLTVLMCMSVLGLQATQDLFIHMAVKLIIVFSLLVVIVSPAARAAAAATAAAASLSSTKQYGALAARDP